MKFQIIRVIPKEKNFKVIILLKDKYIVTPNGTILSKVLQPKLRGSVKINKELSVKEIKLR